MKRFVRSAWALAIAGAFVAPTMAAAQANKPVVAVLSFDNNSIGKDHADYDGVGKGLQDFLTNDLVTNNTFTVVDRDRIQQVLKEQDLAKQGSIDPQTAVRIGKILGAQYMITGGFMSDGRGKVVATARAINVETTQITNPQKVTGSADDVLGLIAQLSTKVSSDMKLPAMKHDMGMGNMDMGGMHETKPAAAKPAETKPAPQVKMDLRTAMLYSKALDAQDAGDSTKATELFSQVLAKFPDYTPARQHLAKVSGSSGD
jgi:TolB-like protein